VDLDSHKTRKWNVGIRCIDSLRTFRLQAGVWLAGDCVRVSYNRSPHQLIAGGPHVLPSQYGPVGPALLANGRLSVVGRWPIDVCSTGWSPRRRRGTGCSWVRRDCPLRTACPPAFFIIPSALLAISFFSLSLCLSRIHTYTRARARELQCVHVMLFSTEQMLWPLLGDPLHSYIHIRDTSVARACIESPPRENSATRIFYSNFRSAYLNPAPFLLSLFVREWLSRRLFCASLTCVHACLSHACVRARAWYRGQTLPSTSCSPSEFHPPPLSRRPTVPDLNVTVVSRATASPTRARNLPIRAFVARTCACLWEHSCPPLLCASNRFALDRLQFSREGRNTRRLVSYVRGKRQKTSTFLGCCQYSNTRIYYLQF